MDNEEIIEIQTKDGEIVQVYESQNVFIKDGNTGSLIVVAAWEVDENDEVEFIEP